MLNSKIVPRLFILFAYKFSKVLPYTRYVFDKLIDARK